MIFAALFLSLHISHYGASTVLCSGLVSLQYCIDLVKSVTSAHEQCHNQFQKYELKFLSVQWWLRLDSSHTDFVYKGSFTVIGFNQLFHQIHTKIVILY